VTETNQKISSRQGKQEIHPFIHKRGFPFQRRNLHSQIRIRLPYKTSFLFQGTHKQKEHFIVCEEKGISLKLDILNISHHLIHLLRTKKKTDGLPSPVVVAPKVYLDFHLSSSTNTTTTTPTPKTRKKI
jgi:hypothetical protein